MTAERRSARQAFVIYTALRIGLVVAFWWLLQLVTPLRGVVALAVAILVSGLISLVVLNKPRATMGEGVAGFFSRLNARIDASTSAEDAWDDERRSRSSATQEQPEQDSVDAEQEAGPLEDGHEGDARRT